MYRLRNDLEADAVIGLVKLKRIKNRSLLYRKKIFHSSHFNTNVLFRAYQISNFPSLHARKDLGYILDMSTRSIQLWFQNIRRDYVPSINVVFRSISSLEIINIYMEERYKLYNNFYKRSSLLLNRPKFKGG
ncbi:hypothetical protein P3W45_000894 [Vairimorpha bombi]|jgi:hypothetical protein